jgi:hypothetical protein
MVQGFYATTAAESNRALDLGQIAFIDLKARLGVVHLAGLLRHSKKPRSDYEDWKKTRPRDGGLTMIEVWKILREFLTNPGFQAELLIQDSQFPNLHSILAKQYLYADSLDNTSSEHQAQVEAFKNYFRNELTDYNKFKDGYRQWRASLGLFELAPGPEFSVLADKIIKQAWQHALFFKMIFNDVDVSSLTAPQVIKGLLGLPINEGISEQNRACLNPIGLQSAKSHADAMRRVLEELMCHMTAVTAKELGSKHFTTVCGHEWPSFNYNDLCRKNLRVLWNEQAEQIDRFAEEAVRLLDAQRDRDLKAEALNQAKRERESLQRQAQVEANKEFIYQFFQERQRPPPPAISLAILKKDRAQIPKSWAAHFGNFISATERILDILDYRGSDHGESAANKMIEELRLGDRIFTRIITAQDIGSQGIKKLVDLLFDPMNLCCVLQAQSKNAISDNDIKKQFEITIPKVTPRATLARELATLYGQDIAACEAIDTIIGEQDLNLFVATLLLPKARIVELMGKDGAEFAQAIKYALTSAQESSERIATIKEKRPPRESAAGKGEAQDVDIATLRKELGDAAKGWALISDGYGGVLAVRERDNLEVELNPSDLVGGNKAIRAFGKKVAQAERDRPAQGLIDTLLGFGFTWRDKTLIHIESGLQVVLNGNLSEKLADLGRLKTAISGYQSQQSELRQVLIESNRILVLDNRDEFAYHFESSGEEHEIDLPPIPHAKITEVLDGARRSAQALVDCTDRSANAALKGEAKQARLFNEYHERLQIKPSSQVLILDANIIFDLVWGQVNGRSLSRILSVLAKVPHQKIIVPATVVFEVLGWIPPEDWSPQGGYLLFPSSERRHLTDLLRNRFSVCTVNEQGKLSPLGSDFSRSSKLVVVFTEADRTLMQQVREIETNSDRPATDRRIAIKKLFVGRDLGEHRIIDLLRLIPETDQPRQVYTRDEKFRRDISRMPKLKLRASPVDLFVQAAAALPKDVAEVFALSPELAAGQLVDSLVAGLRRYG